MRILQTKVLVAFYEGGRFMSHCGHRYAPTVWKVWRERYYFKYAFPGFWEQHLKFTGIGVYPFSYLAWRRIQPEQYDVA